MNIASLFNLAGPDILVILLITLLLFGARKLPELARGMGQAARLERFPASLPRSLRHILARLHVGYGAATLAPFPL